MNEAPPYGSYAGIVGAFLAVMAGVAAAGRDTRARSALDFAALGLATFKGARTLSHDEVASFVREPFVRGHAHEGGEEPKQDGLQQALGELVTCTRCVGTWVAAFLVGTQAAAPRFGRALTWTLATAGVNDFLQAAFSRLTDER